MFPESLLSLCLSTSIELSRPQTPQAQQADQQQQHLAVTSSPTVEPINPELTYTYTPNGVPPHILELKIGVPVMVIRNVLHPYLVNGAMFVLKSFKRNVLCISTVRTDSTPPQTFPLHRIDFQFDFPDFKVTRRQFPIRLAFSATVHKAQGQTLQRLLLDMRSPFFLLTNFMLLCQEQEEAPTCCCYTIHRWSSEGVIHPMPIAVQNPTLKAALVFALNTIS